MQMSGFINRKIDRIFEPRQQGKYGRPDWLFSNKDTMGIYGYVEAKGFNPDIVLNRVKSFIQLRESTASIWVIL